MTLLLLPMVMTMHKQKIFYLTKQVKSADMITTLKKALAYFSLFWDNEQELSRRYVVRR